MPKAFQAITYTQTQIEELSEEEMVYPYNDKYATYVGKYHQYEPTEALFNERGINIKRELEQKANGTSVKEFLSYVRFKFYLYVYSHNKSPRHVMNFIIAKRGIRTYPSMFEYRGYILDAMVYLGEYLLNNGDITQISGIDLDSNTALSIDELRNEDRDYPARFRDLMSTLGLCYYGQYKIISNGLGTEW